MDNHIPVIDTHVHLWNIEHIEYSWLHNTPQINKNFLFQDYAQETEGLNIGKILFVECTSAMDDSISQQEVNWVHTLAEDHFKIQGMIAHASLEKGKDVAEHLAWLGTQPLVRGVRRLLQDEAPDFCLQKNFIEGIRLLKQYDYTFDVCVRHHQLPAITELVKQCPDVKFVLDHIGKPDIVDNQLESWRKHIKELAALPNISCKISGVVTEADHKNWKAEDVAPYINHVIECFGFSRVMYGSDWPVLRLAATYQQWFQLVQEVVKGYSHLERSKFFHENADIIYRLPPIPMDQ